ncbi:hypothetical protein [Marinobacter lutaoensis]|nr:hypothetical protein [Marinobacter lutaoensis]
MQRQIAKIRIPVGLDFSDLKLARGADGSVSFDWSPIEQICRENGLPIEIFRDGPEDNVAGLVSAWYAHHRANGGEIDPVQEDLIAEVIAEDSAGQRYSHKPGSA